MSRQTRKMPSVKAIVAAWADEAPWSRNVDEGNEHKSCWHCGYDMRGNPTRAHIVAHRNGGSGKPRNFFLLCEKCHDAQPDASPLDVQLAWLKSGAHWMDSLMSDSSFMEAVRRAQRVVCALEPEDQRQFTEHLLATMKEQALATHGRSGARNAAIFAMNAECEKAEPWIDIKIEVAE